MTNIFELNQSTKDNLGTPDDTKNTILVAILPEYCHIEEGPTLLYRNTIGSSFVLGHATNAILGTTELGQAGDYVSDIRERVINPKNTFHEHFRFTTFNDSGVTTGTFDTTDYNVQLDINELFQTQEIFMNEESIYYVTPYVDLNGGSTTFIIDGTSKSVSIIEGKTQNV